MAQIDNTYFIREINIPQNVMDSDMSEFITQYEKEILISLLGYALYKDYLANASDTRWVRLIDGHEYTEDYKGLTATVKWEGLVNTAKISFIAYYIYFQWMKFHATDTTSVGESIIEKENASGFSPVRKMVSAWNNCSDLYGKVNDVVINPTAYNFLYKFKDDETNGYDGWIFTPIEKINILSI